MSKTRCKDLDKLHPKVAAMTRALLELCKKEKLNCEVFETYRTGERSNELCTKGTGAPAGYSYHNFGIAVDIVFKDKDGNWSWSEDHDWDKLAELGKQVGFEAGRDWKKPKDSPHFQYTFGLSTNALRCGTPLPPYDQFKMWATNHNICNDESWDRPPTKYELIVMLKRGLNLISPQVRANTQRIEEITGVIPKFKDKVKKLFSKKTNKK